MASWTASPAPGRSAGAIGGGGALRAAASSRSSARAPAASGSGVPATTSRVSSGSETGTGSALPRPRRRGGASPESTGSTTSGGAGGGGGGFGGAVRADPATRPIEATPRPTAATEVRVLIRVPRNSTPANSMPAPQLDSSRARGAAMIAPTSPPESWRTAGTESAGGAPLARWSRPSPPTTTASSPMVTRPATMSSLAAGRQNRARAASATSSGTAYAP